MKGLYRFVTYRYPGNQQGCHGCDQENNPARINMVGEPLNQLLTTYHETGTAITMAIAITLEISADYK